jgi:hypothetical protein
LSRKRRVKWLYIAYSVVSKYKPLRNKKAENIPNAALISKPFRSCTEEVTTVFPSVLIDNPKILPTISDKPIKSFIN